MSRNDTSGARSAPRLYLNGKFYAGARNGVSRVADRLIRELDELALAGEAPSGWDMRLLVPDGQTWAPSFGAIRAEPQRRGHSQAWEQLALPFAARGGTLLSLANLAPSIHSRSVVMVHDAQFRLSPESYPPRLRWGYRALIPRGARGSRLVLTVSDYARDSLATFHIADWRKTAVLPNGGDHILETSADPSILARHALEPGGYCVVFGSAARYKNLHVIFDAFRERGVTKTLVVVGPSREALATQRLPMPEVAVAVGAVDDAALRALYKHAHCLLYPSRTEGFGLPPLEAMWCGCPVVAAPAGAIPEVGRDAICYAGMDDPDEWIAAIDALDDATLRAAKIAAGRARAARFTWRASGERLAALLRPIVEDWSAPA